ncbi:MAG: GNAT family N-acetyltransferase [Bacilli bacterium]|jgi:diamine N-acetyltransferase|nr:GNAT family N-acetyltransferase [Bacilli bacterium]MDD3389166.1 GNAT family N-acetyltransferase [Bacilli bacterium]MDD4345252.1 GNAT family N-acetyltransferase [Bacilli bacterium]MDD4521309.1 GNAT family N-acetyltransferase [Bacilli bacterium]MDY0399617.1 GNAT family N-acetyltransferase [Bacilli bacterium]
MLRLVEVDPDRCSQLLRVQITDEQKDFIDPVDQIIKDHMGMDSCIHLTLNDDDTIIGYALIRHNRHERQLWLDDLMIDAKYQHQGYGRRFLQQLIDYMRSLDPSAPICLSCVKTNVHAIALYTRLGFINTEQENTLGEYIFTYY